jgi:transcriptional regulator with XRE-family HTH domain
LKLPRLKEVRELHGWSQAKLAEESGVSRDSISNYETGHREAWPATAKRLADALGVEIAALLEPARELAASGKGEAPRGAERSRAEWLEQLEGLAWCVEAVADRIQGRDEQAEGADGETLVALFQDAFLAMMGAQLLSAQVNDEAEEQIERAAEKRARSRIEHTATRLERLFDNMAVGLEGEDEPREVAQLAEARHRKRVS